MRATKTKRNAIFILSLGKARAGSPPSLRFRPEGPARLRLTSFRCAGDRAGDLLTRIQHHA